VVLDSLLILIIRSLQGFLRILPETGQRCVGVCLGRLAFFVLKERREVALSNIRRVFHAWTRDQVTGTARRCFENLGVNLVESLLMPFLPKEEFGRRFKLENVAVVEDALAKERGIMTLVFHYGNWEIMGVASWFFHREVIALARPLKRHTRLNAFLNGLREKTGLKIILNVDTATDVITYLRGNRIIAILGDQREKRSAAVYVELFGEKVPTSRGTAMIAMRTGATVIPVYSVREGFLRYRLVFGEPLVMERKGNMQELIYRNTRKINAFLESIILEHPEEWFWVHRRWGRKNKNKRPAAVV
jgi:Kdo2-lipid IVA lauroyltransferase/acyltransferase